MKTMVFSFAAILLLVPGITLSNTSDLEKDVQPPEITKTVVEADEWLNKGNSAYEAKDYDEAIKCYKKATELDPGFASAYYNLGIIYAGKGMLDESITAYKKVLTIKPDYYAARNNLGTIYIKQGMLDEAISELEKVLSNNPNLPQAHFNLGECYFTKKNNAMAADHFYKAGVLFLDRGNKEWTQKSLDSLKKTNAADLEKSLLEKMNTEEKEEKDIILEDFIEIKPK